MDILNPGIAIAAGVAVVLLLLTTIFARGQMRYRRRHKLRAASSQWLIEAQRKRPDPPVLRPKPSPPPNPPPPVKAERPPCQPLTNGGFRILLPTNGREVFTSERLPRNQPYHVTVSGTYSFKNWRCGEHPADALYAADCYENLTDRYRGLVFDQGAVNEEAIVDSERAVNTHVVLYRGTGHRLSIALRPYKDYPATGSLQVLVEPLPVLPRAQALEHPPDLATATLTQEQKKQEELAEKVRRLRVETELLRNWEDPKFRERFAKKYGADLLKRRGDILECLRRQAEDLDLLAHLEKQEPKLLARLRGELEAYLEAERLDVRPDRKPKAPPPPALPARRPPPTPEEWRARLIERKRVKAEDRLAEMKENLSEQRTRMKVLLEAREELRAELSQYDLDDDERARFELEIQNVLGTQEGGNGDGNFEQV